MRDPPGHGVHRRGQELKRLNVGVHLWRAAFIGLQW
jgi:hypothetical protein